MRSFSKKLLFAWAVPALTAVLPLDKGLVARVDGQWSLLDLDLQENYAQATFTVPCAGCLGEDDQSHDDESLVLSFKTHSSEEPCGASNITLNGAYLPQVWNGDFASGSGSFSGSDVEENVSHFQHNLDLEWESACLQANKSEKEVANQDAAQVLTVAVKKINGKAVGKPTGFTISFKQLSPPEILRLEPFPDKNASIQANANDWRDPPTRLRLSISPKTEKGSPSDDVPAEGSLEAEIRALKALEAEALELHRAIREKKKQIHIQLKSEAHSFKAEIQRCDSLTCVLKTIGRKAHGAFKLIYIRLIPHHAHHHHHPPMGRPDDPFAQVWRASSHKGSPEAAMRIESLPPPPPPPHGFPPPPPPPPPHHPGDHPPPPHHAGDHPPPPHHGPPPPHHGPPLPHHGHHESPLLLALKIVVGVLCCGCLITVIQRNCCSLRTRTERAARREERRNARAYRRAAQKLAWRNWWRGNWRDQRRIEDYEEKRALINEQESVLEDAMQEEIRQLRTAHGMVNSLVQAEEGRIDTHCGGHMHCHCHHQQHQYHVPPSPASSVYTSNSLAELPSRPLSRTSSLPGYQSDTSSTAPPAYEEDEDRSDMVSDGFRQYSPSTSSSSSRWTPDSSVFDVSPRPSAETLRYAEMNEDTGVGDVKN